MDRRRIRKNVKMVHLCCKKNKDEFTSLGELVETHCRALVNDEVRSNFKCEVIKLVHQSEKEDRIKMYQDDEEEPESTTEQYTAAGPSNKASYTRRPQPDQRQYVNPYSEPYPGPSSFNTGTYYQSYQPTCPSSDLLEQIQYQNTVNWIEQRNAYHSRHPSNPHRITTDPHYQPKRDETYQPAKGYNQGASCSSQRRAHVPPNQPNVIYQEEQPIEIPRNTMQVPNLDVMADPGGHMTTMSLVKKYAQPQVNMPTHVHLLSRPDLVYQMGGTVVQEVGNMPGPSNLLTTVNRIRVFPTDDEDIPVFQHGGQETKKKTVKKKGEDEKEEGFEQLKECKKEVLSDEEEEEEGEGDEEDEQEDVDDEEYDE